VIGTDAVGDRLAWYRRSHGLTQAELGARVGLSRASISLIERGRRVPSLRRFVHICQALDLSPSYLLGAPAAHRPLELG
jgi:transcriptional regulator with XRE-family HTH domain